MAERLLIHYAPYFLLARLSVCLSVITNEIANKKNLSFFIGQSVITNEIAIKKNLWFFDPPKFHHKLNWSIKKNLGFFVTPTFFSTFRGKISDFFEKIFIEKKVGVFFFSTWEKKINFLRKFLTFSRKFLSKKKWGWFFFFDLRKKIAIKSDFIFNFLSQMNRSSQMKIKEFPLYCRSSQMNRHHKCSLN